VTLIQTMSNPSVQAKVYKNDGHPQVLALVPNEARTVLDLGCGAGDNARALADRGMIVDGVTLSQQEARVASQFCRSVSVHNLEEGLPTGLADSYDVVLACHVLEHICFPEKVLADLGAKIANGGLFIVALPNLLNHRYRLRLLAGVFEYEEGGIMDNTHFRWYTYVSAKRMLERNGFDVLQSFAVGHFPFLGVRKFVPRGIETWVDNSVTAKFPGLFGHNLIYVSRKKQSSTSSQNPSRQG
jgi:2-polyprenyl-3-methyl-5-hydroxy-6-metoxy-1,4-benzoquinol methylase